MKSVLGPVRPLALPLFHSFSGCDTTSQLLGIGKKTAWITRQSMPELTETLLNLTHNPDTFSVDSNDMKQLEKPVRATASAPGPAYVAHRYASATADVSIMTLNKTLEYVIL